MCLPSYHCLLDIALACEKWHDKDFSALQWALLPPGWVAFTKYLACGYLLSLSGPWPWPAGTVYNSFYSPLGFIRSRQAITTCNIELNCFETLNALEVILFKTWWQILSGAESWLFFLRKCKLVESLSLWFSSIYMLIFGGHWTFKTECFIDLKSTTITVSILYSKFLGFSHFHCEMIQVKRQNFVKSTKQGEFKMSYRRWPRTLLLELTCTYLHIHAKTYTSESLLKRCL